MKTLGGLLGRSRTVGSLGELVVFSCRAEEITAGGPVDSLQARRRFRLARAASNTVRTHQRPIRLTGCRP